jgi:phthalate 4,5-dioxygenase oxygenase subunit
MDDENTMAYNWVTSARDEPLSDEERLERGLGNGPLGVDQAAFRSKRNRQNNHLLDRHVQKTETFTGIDGINLQDRALQKDMGRIVDRSKEHDYRRKMRSYYLVCFRALAALSVGSR